MCVKLSEVGFLELSTASLPIESIRRSENQYDQRAWKRENKVCWWGPERQQSFFRLFLIGKSACLSGMSGGGTRLEQSWEMVLTVVLQISALSSLSFASLS